MPTDCIPCMHQCITSLIACAGFDTMVQLIQKVLQLYAASQLKGPETGGVPGLVNQVVYAEEREWATLIK